MDRYQQMQAFLAVIDAGSFVKAADTLGISKAAMSRQLADLETRLHVRLLHRTTRRLSLTAEGELFHARCTQLMADLEEAETELTSQTGAAFGVIRINAPVSFGVLHLAPLWGAFKHQNPQVVLDITLNDRIVDMVDEGYDLAIRIARMSDSSLINRRLAGTRMVLCASPEYLRTHGTPAHPHELLAHTLVHFSNWSARDEWVFEGPQGAVTVKTRPSIRVNNGDTCRATALAHLGFILQPTFLIGNDLLSGALVEVLPQYRCGELGVYAVYPSRKNLSPKVRLMVDFLAAQFAAPPWAI